MKIFTMFLTFSIFIISGSTPTSKNTTCLQKLELLTDSVETLELDSPEDNAKINSLCEDFGSCSTSLKRGATLKATKAIEKINSLCAIIHYLSIDFKECDNKLEANNSTCSQEWNPFPDDIEGDSRESERVQLEACKNFFGKDDCLEKEIKEICDVKTWEKFKENYLELNKIIEACDFD